ncbi:hypothetical protein BDP27DRAFT_1435884 [Rhodocollybia butyracea]|uniref:Uncharacterized protein n=1 Tax=Rhodocollybia butyracea TaxID=206335 RepID=A0A9P5P497_9AGAR|nr:hypothetical protein BDP27DRAFT_1435884 [Rhodocollybia butyracea]
MKTIPPLILSPPAIPQPVRLRRQMHYGEHDVLLNAQLFNSDDPSYLLVRFPGPDNDMMIYWMIPTEEGFEVMDGHRLSSVPLGTLSLSLVEQLHTIFLNLFVDSPTHLFTSDPRVQCMRQRLCYLFERLTTPGLFTQTLMTWRLAQRLVLLLEAEITWLVSVKPTSTVPQTWKVHDLRNVVGTISDDPLAVDRLFCAGIPVWFICQLDLEPAAKVITWFDEHLVPLHLPADFISFEDNMPMRPTLYNSAAEASYDWYRLLVKETWSIAFPIVILGPDASSAGTPSTAGLTNHVAAGIPSSAGPSRTSSATPSLAPYIKPKPKTKNPPQVVCNKFMEVVSPIMPYLSSNWKDTSKNVSKNSLASHDSEVSRRFYFRTYLKLRPILLYTIKTLGPLICQKKPEQWRTYLGLELHGAKSDTCAAKAKVDVCNDLNEIAERMGTFTISLDNLDTVPASWKGMMYGIAIPDDVQREILTEILNISFRHELLLLNRYLYKLVPAGDKDGELLDEFEASTRDQRSMAIEAALFANGPPRFYSTMLAECQAMLYAFFRIMRGWTASKPMVQETIEDGNRLAPGYSCSSRELDSTEYYLAYFYIYSFADFFRRAPVLPHHM